MAYEDIYVSSRGHLAHLFSKAEPTVVKWHQRGMPGIAGLYSLKEVIAWREKDLTERKGVEELMVDADMAGDSPALERFRAARANLAELEFAERSGTMVQVALIQRGLALLAAPLREAIEALQKQFGAEARDIMEEGLAEFERRMMEDFTRSDDSSQTPPNE